MRRYRPNWLEVDLAAIENNAAVLAGIATPASLCAVVKADGYGHGAAAAARAALAGGAACLAVALVEEGLALREAGIAAPVLLLSEPSPEGIEAAVAAGLTPTLYTAGGVAAASRAAAPAAASAPVAVQLKVDTGMHRVGADQDQLTGLAEAVAASPWLRLEALWSHLAVADRPEDATTAEQLRRLLALRRDLAARSIDAPAVHLANTAGALAHPSTRLDLVRCGIGIYGYPPAPGLAGLAAGLRPALSWKARVHLVRRLAAGEALSYGLARPLERDSFVAVVPAGYHDGVPRRLFEGGGAVIVNGRRRPIAGTVTMDQLLVDCGPEGDVRAGDEVVLIGAQDGATITAEDWASWLGTISYEVLCGIGPRVPRVVLEHPVASVAR